MQTKCAVRTYQRKKNNKGSIPCMTNDRFTNMVFKTMDRQSQGGDREEQNTKARTR